MKSGALGRDTVAGIHAIQAVCEAVMGLLEESYRPDLIEPELTLQFAVYATEDFKNASMKAGISLFLYRVHVNTNQRTPFGKNDPGRHQLPLDLHFFLTVWAPQASLQHAILGWALRTLEDHRIFASAELNGKRPEAHVFDDNETVELIDGQLTNEELMRIWDELGTEYRLSVPFIARVLRIDSLRRGRPPEIVRQRQLGYGALERE